MPRKYLHAVRQPDQTVNPLFRFLGVEVLEASPERAALRLPFRPEFIQGAGNVAGGVMAALADEAMAHVVIANLEEGQATVTVEMSLRYFRPVRDQALEATATVLNKGRRMLAAECQVLASGKLAAKASATFFILEKR